jgi:KRAB domain-containing zinc finger protein
MSIRSEPDPSQEPQKKDSFLTEEEISTFSSFCSQLPSYHCQSILNYFGSSIISPVPCESFEVPELVTNKHILVCAKCDTIFNSSKKLEQHEKMHESGNLHICDICLKTFTSKGNLKTHKRVHTGEKPFSCSECGKFFTTNGHLTDHYRVHTGERPFICEICNKTFRRGSTLKKHLFVHSNLKPFKCEVCGRGFNESGNLKVHKRIHDDEKPFQCSVLTCLKRFRTRGQLKYHTMTKTHSESLA